MEIKIEISGEISAQQGVDIAELEADLRAETLDFTKHIQTDEPVIRKTLAPEGAQSEFELIQFLIELAKEPMAIKAALNALIYGVNEIASARSKSSQDVPEAEKSVRVKVLQKEIALPASVAVIKQFIEELTKDG
ncbi:hypothetical protein [Roseibium polysiphoniae]|uniref:Uncharacterized protein n=1 Tax=Roseibium polysiphoniae TaxID=2571221 RepID=A0ABR9C6A9_9HYPH|nr:hypothetical protein [Roseibium polysiphoniae]MBD8875410.1 hypothetical protein [Roseibium polysiphoniae]